MALISPSRVLQTTDTNGAGTYSLIGAGGAFRNFSDDYGNGVAVPYCCSDNQFGYEIGVGTFIAGTPDQIARTHILQSSNGGLAVSWSSTIKQIFAFEVGTSLYLQEFSGSVVVQLSDWSNGYVFTGSGVGSFALPPLASAPRGFTATLKNSGGSICFVSPAAGEQIEALGANALYPQLPQSCGTYGPSADHSTWRQILIGGVATPTALVRVSTGTSVTVHLLSFDTQVIWRSPTVGSKTTHFDGAALINDGYKFAVKTTLGNADSHTLAPLSGTIEGASTYVFNDAKDDITLMSDGVNTDWIIT